MQMLYSMNRDKKLKLSDVLLRYRESITKSYELYLFNLFLFSEIAGYSNQDAARKLAKLLPTEEDKRFTAKLSNNDLLQSISENENFKRELQHNKIPTDLDQDAYRLIYTEYSKTEEYKEYIQQADSQYDDHKKALLGLYKHCIGNEAFNELIEDNFPNWVDDKSLIVGAVKKTLKALPSYKDFFESYIPSEEATRDFGEVLLTNVTENDQLLLEQIGPTLKNWDTERVAVIDMILLKMALSELMDFPTIPTKVTLNEFVEISKMYSTEKSKDFINGILDRLMKKLNKEGKIKKEGRGLME